MELVHGLALDLVRNRRESARFGESGGQRVPRVPAGTARMREVRDCRPVHASAAPGPLRRKLTGSLGGGKARYQLTCDPWGGFDGLRFVTCRDRPHGFLMR